MADIFNYIATITRSVEKFLLKVLVYSKQNVIT